MSIILWMLFQIQNETVQMGAFETNPEFVEVDAGEVRVQVVHVYMHRDRRRLLCNTSHETSPV